MIICMDTPMVAGELYFGSLTDRDRNWHDNVPIWVIREATVEEYTAYCKGEGIDAKDLKPSPYYYQVSVD